jgi:hypothetical protein
LILGVPYIVPIYFIYGLAFVSMGLLVAIEGGRASDVRLSVYLFSFGGLLNFLIANSELLYQRETVAKGQHGILCQHRPA